MKKTTSLNFVTGVFIGALCFTSLSGINSYYISLKQSIIDSNISFIIMYASILISFLTLGIGVCKIINNINRKEIFNKQNFLIFDVMGIILFVPILIYLSGMVFGNSEVWKSLPIELNFWLVASSFMFILGKVFLYGYRLQKEQELTI
mgnify:CR=1 FL=1